MPPLPAPDVTRVPPIPSAQLRAGTRRAPACPCLVGDAVNCLGPERRRRFEHEARAARSLEGPRIGRAAAGGARGPLRRAAARGHDEPDSGRAWRLSTGESTVLLKNAADARYVPTGHLIHLSARETLSAVAFDAERLELLGKAEAIRNKVAQAGSGFTSFERTLVGQFAIAPMTGHLAYVSAWTAPPWVAARSRWTAEGVGPRCRAVPTTPGLGLSGGCLAVRGRCRGPTAEAAVRHRPRSRPPRRRAAPG